MKPETRIKALVLALIFMLAPIAFSQTPARPQQKPEPEAENGVRQRQEWFYKQRAYPLAHIPAGARLKALNQLNRMITAERERNFAPSANGAAPQIIPSTTAWTLIGPQPTLPLSNDPFAGYPTDSGRVTVLAVDPRDTTGNTVYLGAAEGGVWVTTNGGQSWTPVTDSQPSLAVGSIALDPTTNPTTIYVGTGEENFNLDAYYGAGVLKSGDGGKTWTQDATFSQFAVGSPSASGPYIGTLAVDPANNQILLAGVGTSAGSSVTGGIWRSIDGGHSWTVVLPESASGNGTGVVFDPTSPGTAYAALGAFVGNASDGVYKSTDGGATWTPLSTLGIGPGLGRITLAIGPPATSGKPGELLVAIAAAPSSADLLGLFKSTDGGATWTKLSSAPDFCGPATGGQCFYDMAIGVSPVNPLIIYAGGTNDFGGDALTVSTDGGTTWSPDLYAGNNGSTVNSSGQLHTDTHAIAFSNDGTKVYEGNDGGVWMTTNVGLSSNITWSDLNAPLAITQFYPGISILPSSANTGFGGTQDNGTQEYAGNLQWQNIPMCGDGGYTAMAGTATLFWACAAGQGIWEVNGAVNPPTLTPADNGIGTCTSTVNTNCYTADFVPPLVLDPENAQTLYFGTNVVYQTTNGASSWAAISPDLTGGLPSNFVSTISVAPASSNTVYAGTENGKVWMTANAGAGTGATFQEIDTGLPNRTVTQVAADPSTPTTAYVSFSGFSSCSLCDSKGHIFETTNGGTGWTNITGNLPDVPVDAIVVDPVLAQTLYAATDVGVFSTSNDGTTWSPVVTGLPRVAVLGLTLDPQTHVMWAGTHGRSMWALQLPQPPTATPSPASVTFPNENVGTASPSQTVTLTNSGAMPLSISGIMASSGYSQTNNCGTSLAAGSNCTINVTFTPTAAGAVPGAISIGDNLRSSPQSIALTGTGQDFSVSANPNTASVNRGSNATYTITVSPVAGSFANLVSLACSGLPSLTSCSFSPPSVTPGSGSVTSTLTISTTAPSSVFPMWPQSGPTVPIFSAWLGLLFICLVTAILAKRSQRKLAFEFAFSALLICFASAIVACGSASKGPTNPGTTPGTYTVSVTGSSNQLQHSMNVTLTVQ